MPTAPQTTGKQEKQRQNSRAADLHRSLVTTGQHWPASLPAFLLHKLPSAIHLWLGVTSTVGMQGEGESPLPREGQTDTEMFSMPTAGHDRPGIEFLTPGDTE